MNDHLKVTNIKYYPKRKIPLMAEKQLLKDKYAIYLSDCMEVMREFLQILSYVRLFASVWGALPLFNPESTIFNNTYDYQGFLDHYEFVINEIYRITLPGRISAVHCADVHSGNSGNDRMIDLPGDIIRVHEKNGWHYIARYCIWKEPLRVRNRTMAKCLAHKTIVDDSAYCSNAGADYLLIFRKKGDNQIPIEHPQRINLLCR